MQELLLGIDLHPQKCSYCTTYPISGCESKIVDDFLLFSVGSILTRFSAV